MNNEHRNQQEITDTYFEFLEEPQREDTLWAYQYVDEIVHSSAAEGWNLILTLVSAAPSNSVLENLGAGHIEDLLKYHGAILMPQLWSEANRNSRLITALRCTRVTNDYPAGSQFAEFRKRYKLDRDDATEN